MKYPISDEELAHQMSIGEQQAKQELKAYHSDLKRRYGHIPKWAGPFHYCFKCKGSWPNLCEDHKY